MPIASPLAVGMRTTSILDMPCMLFQRLAKVYTDYLTPSTYTGSGMLQELCNVMNLISLFLYQEEGI